jgi:hypothetical protein
MTIKDQIIQELEQIPESKLEELLEVVRSFKAKSQNGPQNSDVWNAYLASKRDRVEVYRRLANS